MRMPRSSRKLLSAGANPNLAASLRRNAADAVRANGKRRRGEVAHCPQAEVNAKDNERGQTPLMWAVAEKHSDRRSRR